MVDASSALFLAEVCPAGPRWMFHLWLENQRRKSSFGLLECVQRCFARQELTSSSSPLHLCCRSSPEPVPAALGRVSPPAVPPSPARLSGDSAGTATLPSPASTSSLAVFNLL